MSEDICREKISLEFELFYIQKKEELNGELREWEGEGLSDTIKREKRKKVLTDALEERNKEFEECKLSKKEIADTYTEFTQKKEYEVYEGFFKERKKCNYCLRLLEENYKKGINRYKPCDKIAAQRKLMRKIKLSEQDKHALTRGYLDCDSAYMPMLDREEIDAELNLMEREHILILEAWRKQYERIMLDNF